MATLHVGKKKITLPDVFERFSRPQAENGGMTPYLRATLLGFVGGLRSALPFAMLHRTREHNIDPSESFTWLLTGPLPGLVSDLLASGEMLGDKLPIAPSRIKPLPLIGRIGVGAFAGWSICRRYHRSVLLGALLGALAATGGSYAGYYARVALARSTPLPAVVPALLEDGVALGLGYLAVKDNSRQD